MAQVATVYSIARWHRTSADVLHGLRDDGAAARPRPTNKRVWASAQRAAQHVISVEQRSTTIGTAHDDGWTMMESLRID
jgi:hypothetical protein